MGERSLLLTATISQFEKTNIYRNLGLSEDKLIENKAHTIVAFLLSEAGLDLSDSYTPYVQTMLSRMLHALLDEVYGDRR